MNTLQLEKRDKISLACAAVAVLLVVFMLLYLPAGPLKNHQEAEAELRSIRDQVGMLQSLKQEEEARLRSQEAFVEQLNARPRSFDFTNFVDQALRETNLHQRYQLSTHTSRQATANQPMLDVDLQGVNLDELVSFLHRIYTSGNLIAVYEVNRIEPAVDQRGLDFKLVLVTVRV